MTRSKPNWRPFGRIQRPDPESTMLVAPIIPLAVIMCGSAVIITVVAAVSRAVTQRQRATPNLPNDEVLRRLERIEQAVEVTAIEVERLAEANRFLTKLLADKSAVS